MQNQAGQLRPGSILLERIREEAGYAAQNMQLAHDGAEWHRWWVIFVAFQRTIARAEAEEARDIRRARKAAACG